jgi:hypothetical protein
MTVSSVHQSRSFSAPWIAPYVSSSATPPSQSPNVAKYQALTTIRPTVMTASIDLSA